MRYNSAHCARHLGCASLGGAVRTQRIEQMRQLSVEQSKSQATLPWAHMRSLLQLPPDAWCI
eukprot:2730488-Pleurochrysis_carterae.AAC.2